MARDYEIALLFQVVKNNFSGMQEGYMQAINQKYIMCIVGEKTKNVIM